jgi:hypothetical protein
MLRILTEMSRYAYPGMDKVLIRDVLGFIICSRDDLESSRFLYEKRSFAHSVFHLTQSAEKLSKSLVVENIGGKMKLPSKNHDGLTNLEKYYMTESNRFFTAEEIRESSKLLARIQKDSIGFANSSSTEIINSINSIPIIAPAAAVKAYQ